MDMRFINTFEVLDGADGLEKVHGSRLVTNFVSRNSINDPDMTKCAKIDYLKSIGMNPKDFKKGPPCGARCRSC